jgi:hypothetical protein
MTSNMTNDMKRIRSRVRNLWLSFSMVLLLIDGVILSAILGSFIGVQWLSIALFVLGSLLSIGVFGTFAIQGLRVGVSISGRGDLAVHSLGVSHTARLDAVAGVVVYHGYSSHGRFYAPAIVVNVGEGRQRLFRLWWLASGEDAAQKWANELTHSISAARFEVSSGQ